VRCGKAKTAAIAAFLGESGIYPKKTRHCCAVVTKFAAETAIGGWMAAPKRLFVHKLPDAPPGATVCAQTRVGRRLRATIL
jgi:hypothetical protein